ncbi:LysR family transcriptional regulator [Variovorax saccharolyticus]|uniref:LysR family transcriptional regulator n=1 Tax=Variovorax saccharolyticus TaxID=3053516 RepID=UPI00257565D8|nr:MULTISPECIES: LysR substrate-binding domain-containing protein [unclassified Variovorax]MDM0022397.1 LysR substrate-binding domain-containing protein [Variovorax sp. J22R187]MDM0029053.1 LysR substrate-binding domain-containing protein [Variovorax sp. J31P216]
MGDALTEVWSKPLENTNESLGRAHYSLVMSTRRPRASPPVSAQAFLQRHLKLRQLRLLVALDQHRHVGRVAEAMHLTQPAVSKALAELERGLGMSLFARTPQGLVPTPEGVCLTRHAQSVHEDLNRAALALDSIGQPEVWRVAVGAMHGTTSVIPMAFERLQRQRTPTTAFDLTVQEGSPDLLLPLLRAGKLDVVMGVAPERSAAADLHVVPLYVDPMVWMVAPGHPLARADRPTLHDLADSMWVLPPRVARVRAVIDAMLRRNRVLVPSRLVETVSFDSLLGMVCDHGAVALSTRRLARSAETRGLVQVLDIDMAGLVLPISAMTLVEPEPSAYAVEFFQCLVEASAR